MCGNILKFSGALAHNYKPNIRFLMGHRQTMKTQIAHCTKGRLIKTCTICFKNGLYQPSIILTELLHVGLINVAYLMACAFIRSS